MNRATGRKRARMVIDYLDLNILQQRQALPVQRNQALLKWVNVKDCFVWLASP